MPEFHRLPRGEAPRALYALLAAGPDSPRLTTAVPKNAKLLQVAEQEGAGAEAEVEGTKEGGLVLDPGHSFWKTRPQILRDRIAQVVNTMAGIEAGHSVTLLDGPVPGRVIGVGGRIFRGPVQTTDLGPPRPIVRIAQPAPGTTLGSAVPVRLVADKDLGVRVLVEQGDAAVAEREVHNGVATLRLGAHEAGSATVKVVVEAPGGDVEVTIPVSLSG